MATYLHRDTQGPCPDGYHIPIGGDNSEWVKVYNILVSFGLASSTKETGFINYLKMPPSGVLSYSNGAISDGGGFYLTATEGTSSSEYHLDFRTGGTYVRPNASNSTKSNGMTIRPFKNIPSTPTSSWTTLYQGSGNAGIFHNPSEGIISLSSDGVDWITIADKNLGATTVYNNGNTLSEANCGKYYQWGNNYGFSRNGVTKTSSTVVNASTYGPGNYYNSDTFIIQQYNGWESSGNKNIWGGVTDERVYDPTRIIKKFYHMGVEYKIKGGKPTPSTYTPGIYHNPSLGLISLSSDGSEWITIADKNLGATTVYNDGATLSEANCGKYYQWGNNYGFPWTGSVTTSSTQVNAGSYGPNNYYSSSTYITGNSGWDTSKNKNLRGDITDTNEARRGPCSTDYHVPKYAEWQDVYNIGVSLGAWTSTGYSTSMNILKMPLAGQIGYSGTLFHNNAGYYISSTPFSDVVYFYGYSTLGGLSGSNTTSGCSIRPFANTPVVPDGSWTVLYQ